MTSNNGGGGSGGSNVFPAPSPIIYIDDVPKNQYPMSPFGMMPGMFPGMHPMFPGMFPAFPNPAFPTNSQFPGMMPTSPINPMSQVPPINPPVSPPRKETPETTGSQKPQKKFDEPPEENFIDASRKPHNPEKPPGSTETPGSQKPPESPEKNHEEIWKKNIKHSIDKIPEQNGRPQKHVVTSSGSLWKIDCLLYSIINVYIEKIGIDDLMEIITNGTKNNPKYTDFCTLVSYLDKFMVTIVNEKYQEQNEKRLAPFLDMVNSIDLIKTSVDNLFEPFNVFVEYMCTDCSDSKGCVDNVPSLNYPNVNIFLVIYMRSYFNKPLGNIFYDNITKNDTLLETVINTPSKISNQPDIITKKILNFVTNKSTQSFGKRTKTKKSKTPKKPKKSRAKKSRTKKSRKKKLKTKKTSRKKLFRRRSKMLQRLQSKM